MQLGRIDEPRTGHLVASSRELACLDSPQESGALFPDRTGCLAECVGHGISCMRIYAHTWKVVRVHVCVGQPAPMIAASPARMQFRRISLLRRCRIECRASVL